ncbi:hypothetical protein FALCPG4_19075 [Fusarium falciforme]
MGTCRPIKRRCKRKIACVGCGVTVTLFSPPKTYSPNQSSLFQTRRVIVMSFARLTVGGRGLHLENRLASESVRVSTTKCVMFSILDTHPPPQEEGKGGLA